MPFVKSMVDKNGMGDTSSLFTGGRLLKLGIPLPMGCRDMSELIGFAADPLIPRHASEGVRDDITDDIEITPEVEKAFKSVLAPPGDEGLVAKAKAAIEEQKKEDMAAIERKLAQDKVSRAANADRRRIWKGYARRLVPVEHDISNRCAGATLVFLHPSWTLHNYKSSGDFGLTVGHLSHSIILADCEGDSEERPLVIRLAGNCRGLHIRNCLHLVVLADGVITTLSVNGGGRLSVFIDSAFPSPITAKGVKGVQITSYTDLVHASVSSSNTLGFIMHCVPRPPSGHGMMALLKCEGVRTLQLPGDAVIVLQRGKITKTADRYNQSLLGGQPRFVTLPEPDYYADEGFSSHQSDWDSTESEGGGAEDGQDEEGAQASAAAGQGGGAGSEGAQPEEERVVFEEIDDDPSALGGKLFEEGGGGLLMLSRWRAVWRYGVVRREVL